jgi:hypothetical protein
VDNGEYGVADSDDSPPRDSESDCTTTKHCQLDQQSTPAGNLDWCLARSARVTGNVEHTPNRGGRRRHPDDSYPPQRAVSQLPRSGCDSDQRCDLQTEAKSEVPTGHLGRTHESDATDPVHREAKTPRGTAVSLMAEAGVPLEVAANLVGHATNRMTAEVDNKVRLRSQVEALEKLEALVG